MLGPRVWIGGWRHVEHLDPTKSHTVYQVEVTTSLGRYVRIERRYSAFLSLHKECRRYYQTPPFPPKKIRNTTARVLESRRAGLEHYIQSLAKISPTPPQLLAFLQLPEEITGDGTRFGEHAPVIGYASDPYLMDHDHLDMISEAALCAFYDDHQ